MVNIRESKYYLLAERDYKCLSKAFEVKFYDNIFLQVAAQCVEKYLKTILHYKKPKAGRIMDSHDLTELKRAVSRVGFNTPDLESMLGISEIYNRARYNMNEKYWNFDYDEASKIYSDVTLIKSMVEEKIDELEEEERKQWISE